MTLDSTSTCHMQLAEEVRRLHACSGIDVIILRSHRKEHHFQQSFNCNTYRYSFTTNRNCFTWKSDCQKEIVGNPSKSLKVTNVPIGRNPLITIKLSNNLVCFEKISCGFTISDFWYNFYIGSYKQPQMVQKFQSSSLNKNFALVHARAIFLYT